MSQEQSTASHIESVTARVHKILREQLGLSPNQEISANAHLERDLKADSLDRLELTMALEDEFGITVLDEDAEKLTTVQEVLDYFVANVKSS